MTRRFIARLPPSNDRARAADWKRRTTRPSPAIADCERVTKGLLSPLGRSRDQYERVPSGWLGPPIGLLCRRSQFTKRRHLVRILGQPAVRLFGSSRLLSRPRCAGSGRICPKDDLDPHGYGRANFRDRLVIDCSFGGEANLCTSRQAGLAKGLIHLIRSAKFGKLTSATVTARFPAPSRQGRRAIRRCSCRRLRHRLASLATSCSRRQETGEGEAVGVLDEPSLREIVTVTVDGSEPTHVTLGGSATTGVSR
jgi:hypothetical protein